ncbi:MAG TPA: hypothetical protein VK455_07985 [Thermoplasmata archaeon]|nr:hypothetical protein [Thermoplasmata archaeon]
MAREDQPGTPERGVAQDLFQEVAICRRIVLRELAEDPGSA